VITSASCSVVASCCSAMVGGWKMPKRKSFVTAELQLQRAQLGHEGMRARRRPQLRRTSNASPGQQGRAHVNQGLETVVHWLLDVDTEYTELCQIVLHFRIPYAPLPQSPIRSPCFSVVSPYRIYDELCWPAASAIAASFTLARGLTSPCLPFCVLR
jgi:hypothetical protein